MGKAEMSWEQLGPMLDAELQHLHSGRSGNVRLLAECRVPMRRIELQRVMQDIAGKQSPLHGTGKPHRHMAARMPWRRNNGQRVVERVLSVNDDRLPRFDDRQNAVAIGIFALKIRLRLRIAAGIAQIMLEPGKQILCIGESRNPATVLQHRIPADMVGMQMGAENDIDVLGSDTCVAKPLQVGMILLMKSRKTWAAFVVTAAAVEKDRVMFRTNEPGMDARNKPILLR